MMNRLPLYVALLSVPALLAAGDVPQFKDPQANQVMEHLDAMRNRARIILGRAINDAKGRGDGDEVKKLQGALADIPVGDEEDLLDTAGRVTWRGSTYQLVQLRVSWDKARELCEAFGGQLVCIDDDREQLLVSKLAAGRRVWIGASDVDREGQWKWVNGQSVRFTAWGGVEPNNIRGVENYAMLSASGTWLDVPGGTASTFICEWE